MRLSRSGRPASRASPSGREFRITNAGSVAADAGAKTRGAQNLLQLAGADDGVDFRNVLLDFVAIAFDQAAGDDQLLRAAGSLVLRHLQDGVDRLLLGSVDERAGVDDDDVGVFGAGVIWAPPCASRPIITSLSTRFLGQPRLTNPIFFGMEVAAAAAPRRRPAELQNRVSAAWNPLF